MAKIEISLRPKRLYQKIVKQVMRESYLIDKLHRNEVFLQSDFKAVRQEVDAIYLTQGELHTIHEKPIDQEFVDAFYPRATSFNALSIIASYNIVKKRFLIGAYTGLRMSDFNKIDKGNIKDGFITVITDKTDQKVIIPMHPIVKDILKSGFDFESSLSEAKTRLYIKEICKYAGIIEEVEVRKSIAGKTVVSRHPKWELVSTHTARRSFATNAYKAGVPTIAIMKITGHTQESTFMRYIRITQQENAETLAEHKFFKSN